MQNNVAYLQAHMHKYFKLTSNKLTLISFKITPALLAAYKSSQKRATNVNTDV